MKFNSLIPELTVSDIEKSKKFYIEILEFKLEYERVEDLFIFISKEGNQFMLEQENGAWNTGELVFPYGRGVNFEMNIEDVESLYNRIIKLGIKPFRELKKNTYKCNGEDICQNEFLIQDPDGYLLRFTD